MMDNFGNAVKFVSFWNCEPVRDLTAPEIEIVHKIENRIEKTKCPASDISCQCFIHPQLVWNKFEGKPINVRRFVFGIFNKDLCQNNQKIYLRCTERKCVNPTHFVKTTQKIGDKLIKIGWKHYGKPEQEIERIFELQTLLENGKRDETTGCLLYTKCLDANGYGISRNKYVHRHRWQLDNPGVTLTPDMHVRHKCKNRHCFDIEHLEIGTAVDNARDRRRDGTQLMGENHPNAKLTKESAQIIKNNYDDETCQVRANRYTVHRETVGSIDRGILWGDLPYRGEPDNRREAIAEKKYERNQHMKQRIPNPEDYENVWKRILKRCKESWTKTYNDVPCLLLQKTRRNGYGSISFVNSSKLIHVVIWEKFHNNCQIQDDKTKVIRHLCGNKACVQPSHLKLGTKSENAQDRRTHGTQRGISKHQAREVFRLKEVDGLKPKEISDKLGINWHSVISILYKQSHLYIHKKMLLIDTQN